MFMRTAGEAFRVIPLGCARSAGLSGIVFREKSAGLVPYQIARVVMGYGNQVR
jgi:hypothetical protein